jgi:hypothetical protein
MARAWAQEDADGFADVLLACDLYLPGFPDAGEGGQRLLTRERGGQTYLLVYVSVQALQEAMAEIGAGWRRVTFAELAGAWPDDSWGLAVSPHTPIGAYLGPEQLRELVGEVAAEPAFAPADERERAMRAAQQTGDAEVYLDLLVISDVLLPVTGPARPQEVGRPGFPWLVQRSAAGDTTVPVFTSPQRLADAWPAPEATPQVIRVPFMTVARSWPDDRYRLAVNPGSVMSAVFTGAQVPDLVHWAQELVLRHTERARKERAPDGAPPAVASAVTPQTGPSAPVSSQAAAPVVAGPQMRRVQTSISSEVAQRYLTAGGNRVSGVVQPAGPADDGVDYLVRWHEDMSVGPEQRPVTELSLPHGAQLIRLIAGQELVVGTFDLEVGFWRPSLLNVLRGEIL